MTKRKCTDFFDMPTDWQAHWREMPSFNQRDLTPFQTVHVHFRSPEDRQAFSEMLGQRLTPTTRSIWWPGKEIVWMKDTCFDAEEPVNPRYPVYVISKGRWESRLTSRALEWMGVPYSIVIEPHEFDQYAEVIDERKILMLPFSNLGRGSIPARNWVWKHARKTGARRHWILDDNIRIFYRLYQNKRIPVKCPNIFRAAEDFVDRYDNVALAGFQYKMFAKSNAMWHPYNLNTRIYSCILIRNDLFLRWRGRYNEDTDLSLRVLKDGWCTVLFYAFLANKITTMVMKGGNTDELYREDGRYEMAKSLKDQHPDVVRITKKWGRWQHHVDYSRFKRNRLIPRSDGGLGFQDRADEYGMYLRGLTEEEQKR